MRHIPVLLNEVVDALSLKSNKNVIDCTLGDGGHTEKILEKIAPNGKVLGIDADPESLFRAKQFLYRFGDRVTYVRDNFVNIRDIVHESGFGPVQGIVIDLGWSSPQFEERGRGFSFQKDEPLDMRYSVAGQTAALLINTVSPAELEKILREFGEENLSKEIAVAIVEKRKNERIETTGQLVEIILDTYRKKIKTKKEIPWVGGLHPATKIFQALRIAVNDELGVLEKILAEAIEILEPGGRLAVITFHSLEDRIVKHQFKALAGKKVTVITKKPIECAGEEWSINPRARSAKLRVVEKIESTI